MLVCNFNLFDLHQNIFLVDKKGKTKCVAISSLEDLGNTLEIMCLKHKENKVKLFGNEEYAKKIKENINSKYSNIEIEVNDKNV